MAEYIKIPEERLALIIADAGKVKKLIESSTGVTIEIDTDTCEVSVLEGKKMEDPLSVWRARDVVHAIGRGFDPELALELLNPAFELKIIDLTEYGGGSKNSLIRIRSRIIGSSGKSKQFIEDATDTHIVVYGKTVCIIGPAEKAHVAAVGIDALASGAMHGSVYKLVEKEIANLNRYHR